MADNKVTLEVQLKTSKEQFGKLQQAGAFKGPGGAQTSKKIDEAIRRLESIDISKLKGPDLTQFINDIRKLRGWMDKAAASLSNYSDEFKKQQEAVALAEKNLGQANKKKTKALEDQAEAAKKIALDEKHTYFNKKTGRQVTKLDTIADLYNSGDLDIRGATGKKSVKQETYDKVVTSTGIKAYAETKQEVANATIEINSADIKLKEAQQKLSELQQNETGGISPLGKEVLDTSGQYRDELIEIQDKDNKGTEAEIHAHTAAVDNHIQSINKQTSSLGRAFKQFTIYATVIRFTKRALREAVDTVKELDKELTEQAMVTGLTREQTYKLVKSYQNLAKQTGATTKEIASVATEYMKQGKSINDALILTEAAVSAAKVARVSTADSVNYLTTALNGFQLSANDAMLVSDKFAAVAAASASDYDELAIALSKVASQANLAGMSIDYTTALLTKGLETTREAPETMGTALKTIIARMRELSDYGETLEGDVDINNVEQQLAYVGIQLRNTNGELRSTEDVLNELGMAWDDLSKNQQAAVAKALAGTRQQSRLIAMMSDYDRVLELQDISQRSAGATAAQAGVYLEGMEAAMNRVAVAWEKIVSTMTNSEVIINLVQWFASTLERLGTFLEKSRNQVAVLGTIATIVLSIIGNKIIEHNLAKQDLLLKQKLAIAELKEQRLAQLHLLLQLKQGKVYEAALKVKNAEARLEKAITAQVLIQQKARNGIKVSQKEITDANNEYLAASNEAKVAEQELANAIREQGDVGLDYLDTQRQITEQTTSLGGILGIITSAISGIVGILGIAFGVVKMIATVSGVIVKLKDEEYRKTLRNTIADKAQAAVAKIKAAFGMADSASGISKTGWIIAIGILSALAVAGITTAIVKNNQYKKSAEGTAENINKISNKIYQLEERANAINQVTSAFEALDNKVIKTKKDIEEMNELLDSATDSLSSETYKNEKKAKKAGAVWYGKDMSEQDYYKTLSDKDKIRFLQDVEKRDSDLADSYRQEQLAKIKALKDSEKTALLNEDTSNIEFRKAQSALYAINNNNLYDYIDKLKEAGKITDETAAATEELTENLLAELDTYEALNLANQGESGVASIVDRIKDLQVTVDEDEVYVTKILTSDDYGITQKAAAFKKLATQFGTASDEYKMLATAYAEYETFAKMGEDTLKMIDYLEISIDEINKLNEAYDTLVEKGLKMSQQEYKNLITSDGGILDTLTTTGGDIASTIQLVFGDALSSADDYYKTYQALVKTFSDMLGQGSLNMGQNITKLQNQIGSFYEKASEWNSLSESEKTEFMVDNEGIFKDNPELLHYLETNNWAEISEALSKSETLQDSINKQIKYIETELEIQKALGEEADKNYTKWLLDRKAELLDTTNLFRADLELLINQQQEQLDIYRDYLEKQQEQLEESLDKRKQAYEEYFDAINQQQEDEDYQEQSDLLVSNLSKLASSTDAAANKQRAELEQQLEDLEEERQQTLRERAQEAVIENLDREVEEINDKFDKLLENEQLLLEAMQGDIALSGEDAFLGKILATARANGMTDLQIEDFTNQVSAAMGSIMDVSGINEVMETIQNNATINIGDQTFDLDTEDGNVVWQTLLAMLTKYGYGR